MKKQLHSIKLLKFLSFSCLLLLGINMGWGQNVQSLSATTSTTWLCPAGVTSVQVETWSGGGGGGGASSNTKIYVGGGGAGGNYAKQTAVTVIPGHTYNVNIGAGGIAGASTSALGYGGIGGTTSFVDQTGTLTLLSVSGGTGGQLGTAAYTSGWGGTNAGGNLSAIVITAGAYTAAPTIVIGKQWVSGATYVLNEQVFSGANLYTVTSISSGAGAGTIAPTGTSTSVNNGNGTAVLTYAGVAATASTNATFGYVKFVNVGSGYTTAPTVTISGGTFTLQGAATAYINPFVTTNVNGTGTFTTYKGGSGTAGYYVASTAGNSSGTGGGGAGSSGNGGNGTLPSAASTSYSGGTGGTGAGNGASNSIATAAGGTFNGVAGGVAGGGSGAAYSGTGGAGGAGKVVITILDLTPPANPGTLTVPNIAANSLGLSWVASADAANADFTGYLVVRYTSAPAADNDPVQNVAYTTGSTFSTGASPMTGTVVSIGTATNASDTGLTTGTKYYYKVYAFDSNRNYSGESSASETPANVVDITPPGNPGVATITNQTTSSLTVNWVAASNGTEGGGYLVVRYTGTPEADSNPVTGVVYDLVTVKTIATGTPPVTDPVTTAKNGTVVYTGNNLTLNQSGLLAEKNYYYRVFTFDAAYNYSAASIVTGKTSVQLTAPVANAGSNTSGTGFTTNWDAVAESATGYSPTGYTATVYNLGAESTLVGWTIPATVAEASTLTADITTTNTTTSQLTQSNGTINTGSSGSTAAGSGTGSSGFSARGASYYPISTSVFATATIETVAGSGPYTAIISAMSSTSGLSAGQPLTATAGTGDLGLGTMTIVSIIDATSINVTSTDTFTAGTVTALTVTKTKATPDKYWQVDANTTGYKNIKISSQQYSAADGTRDFKVQYSSTGASGTFTDLTTVTLVASTWNTQVSGIALPAECDNNANVVLRWLQTSFTRVDGTEMTTTSGTSRIDNVLVKGQLLTSVATASAVGPAATSVAVTGLTTGGIYYYDVVATGTNTTNSGGLLTSYATSAKSNLISYTFLIPEGYANFRSKGTASTSSASNWEFNDGVSWFNATVAPTSTNNITVSAANEVTVGADFSVSLGKSITVASTGTINLAGHVVSGAGSFVLSSGASLKLGNNASIATAITTTTTLNTAANYFYDGTVAQNTTALPGLSSTTVTMTGNVTVSNAAGVTLANNLKIQTPGTLEVTATGKLLWGDGNVTSATIGSGTFTTSGSGYFIARTGSTLVITSSKGIGYMDALSPTSTIGSIKNTAASGRTFEPNVNYIFAKNDAANAINMGTAFVSGTDTNIALNISATAGINNLTISNPLGVYLPGAVQAVNAGGVTVTDYVPDTDITVNGVLNLVSGQLIANNGANLTTTVGVINVYSTVPQTTGTKTVTIANSGSITGAGSGTGWVIGNLKKATVSGDRPSFTYTIGDATNYTPLALTFIGNTTATGGLTARVNTGDHASVAGSGIDATKSVNRTWTLTNDALAGFGSYNAAFAYANADNDAGTTPANYLAHLYSGSAWSILTPSGTATTTAATATGITGFGDFAIGECASLTTTGSVTTSICAGDSYHWDANNTDYTTAQTGVTVVSGCNTATLNLSITPLTTTGSVTTSICAGGTYHWDANNTDYTTAQTGLTHTVGCNTATLNLTVNPLTTTGSVTLSQNGGSYTWATVNGGNGLTYTASATATVVTGCNTATLNLTISATVIPTSPLNLCKGATVASVTGTTSLKFYKDNVTTTQLVSTTKFVTAVTYYVTETNSGNESSRVPVTITVNNLPATPSGLTSTESGLICKYINSSSPVTFTATAAGTISSYIWTVPTGASFTSGATAVEANPTTGTGTIDSIGLSFEEVSATPGPIGSVTVKIVDANGCISLPKALALTTKVPTAPTSLVMTSLDDTDHFKGIITQAILEPATAAVYGLVGLKTLTAGIKKVGPYMDTATEFILTAPAAVTAASYLWTLPSGVNAIASGTVAISSLGVVTSTTPVITANFADVTPGTTALPIVVQSVGGCGNSTNRTLSLARTVPSAPTALVLTNTTQANLSSLLKITKVGPYTGTNIEFTLTGTPFTTQGATATSYAWVLPAGVVCTSPYAAGVTPLTGSTVIATVSTPWTITDYITTTTSTITVKFSGAATKTTGDLLLSVYAVNGTGNSVARTLKLARALPTAPTKLVLTDATTTVVAKAGVYAGKETPLTLTATPFLVQGAEATSYKWILPEGVTVTTGATEEADEIVGTRTWTGTDTVLTVNLELITTVMQLPMTVHAVNGAGTSLPKALTTVATALPSPVAAVAGSLNVCNREEGFVYTITAPFGANKYLITAPAGSVVSSTNGIATAVGGSLTNNELTTTDLTFKVVYSGTTAFLTTDKALKIQAGNATGFLTTAKSLTLVRKTTCVGLRAIDASVADEFSVTAYPNPSSSDFTIQASRKGATVKVYDMMGRLIENRQATSNTVQVGSRFAAGAYNVIVKQGANTKTLKVIKK